jgi:hypothetical protein
MVLLKEEKEGVVSCIYKSSNILASNYDQNKKELNITFKEGRNYTYSGVEYKEYLRFEIAESQGEIFSKHIKKHDTKKNDNVDVKEILSKISELTKVL